MVGEVVPRRNELERFLVLVPGGGVYSPTGSFYKVSVEDGRRVVGGVGLTTQQGRLNQAPVGSGLSPSPGVPERCGSGCSSHAPRPATHSP